MYDLNSLENRKDFAHNCLPELFLRHGIRRAYGKNEIIFHRGEAAPGIFYVKNGKVRGYFSHVAGEEFTVTILEHGILIGEDAFMSPPRRILDVVALQPTVVYYMETERLMSLAASDSAAMNELFGFFMKKILTLSYQMIASLQLTGEKKIAFLLLEIHAQENGMIRHTHEELAGMAGVSRVTASKILRSLEQRGAIALRYKHITMGDESILLDVLND